MGAQETFIATNARFPENAPYLCIHNVEEILGLRVWINQNMDSGFYAEFASNIKAIFELFVKPRNDDHKLGLTHINEQI